MMTQAHECTCFYQWFENFEDFPNYSFIAESYSALENEASVKKSLSEEGKPSGRNSTSQERS